MNNGNRLPEPVRPPGKKSVAYWVGQLFGVLLLALFILGAAVAVKLLWVMLWA